MIIEYNDKKPWVSEEAFVAPNAALIGDVEVAEHASIWFGVQLRGDVGRIRVGARTNIQDNVAVHMNRDEETIIEADVTVGHGAVLHGCTIRKGAVIGIGAVILDDAVIGEQAMVAAGSVVTPGTQIPPRHLAMGTPAKVGKELDGSALWWVQHATGVYMELAKSYRQQGIGKIDST
jgi:carbonic anhydrase/acetyltransferase-like protein (isoleucine patch superfamily)